MDDVVAWLTKTQCGAVLQRKASVASTKLTTSSSYIPLLATDSAKSQFLQNHSLERGSRAGPKIAQVIEEIASSRAEEAQAYFSEAAQGAREADEGEERESVEEKAERKLLKKHVNQLSDIGTAEAEAAEKRETMQMGAEGNQREDRLTERRGSRNAERKVRKILYDPTNSGSPSDSEISKAYFEEIAPNGDVLFVGNVHLPLYQRILVRLAKFVNPF